MNRSWMFADRRSQEYEEGVEQFLNFAILRASNRDSIRCPCLKCGNLRNQTPEEIRAHLFFNGVDRSYRTWIWHGEEAPNGASPSISAQFEKCASDDVADTVEMNQAAEGLRLLVDMLPSNTPMDLIQSNDEKDSNTPRSQKRKGRGRTCLPHVMKNRSAGVRKVVNYNKKGQPVGKVKTEMMNYLGILGRTKVPITYDTWHKVPKELKNKLWGCVESLYILDRTRRKSIVSAISSKWKSFKYKLTKYIMQRKDQPELLRRPPKLYNFIKQRQWDAFVRDRLSEGFQKNSEIQKERRAKNIYNHRLSRKGYAGWEEDYQKASETTDELDRSVLWKKARQNKNGEYANEAIRECAEKIDELTKQIQDGNVDTAGSIDILTMALGTPEHPGRVRGVGQFVTPKTYFHTTKGYSKLEEKQKLMELQLQSLVAELKSLKKQIPDSFTPLSERFHSNCSKSDVHPRSKDEVVNPKKEITKSKPCTLALGSKENIVIRGTVIETLRSTVRVSIDVPIIGDALLPIPVLDDLTIVKEAVGSHVYWPKDLVILSPDEGSLKERQLSHNNLPVLQFLMKYVERHMKDDYVKITMEQDIFGQEISSILLKEDITCICNMKPISDVCIAIYIRHLYEVLKKSNLEERFGFVNPTTISSAGSKKPNEERSHVLSDRLVDAKPNQLFFIPYNPGFHWILIVVDPSSMTAYYLDPMQSEIRVDIKEVINNGLKMLHAQSGRKKRKKTVWEEIKCPKQPADMECGFYIMRYMKELIADQSLPIVQKFNGKTTFTQAEIDEVRSEWAIAVQEFV